MVKLQKDGIPAGNWENKYNTKNPIVNFLIKNFKNSIYKLLKSRINQIHSFTECGCGEGEITRYIYFLLNECDAKAFDFSEDVINIAKKNNKDTNIIFQVKNIYTIDESYKSNLIVCCEVLEHLDNPELALKKLNDLGAQLYLFSVPNEPIWRILNLLRGKYIKDLGNTPGHINHWSTKQFIKLLSSAGFQIIEANNPFPWSMVLAKIKQ